MALIGRRVTVATTATRLDSDDGDDQMGSSIAVWNAGTAAVVLGDSDVTASTGFELAVGETISVDLGQGETLHAIVATATQIVHVLESGV